MKPSIVVILLAQAGIKPIRLHYPTDKEDNQIWITETICVYAQQEGNYAAVAVMTGSGERMCRPRSMLLGSGRRALVEDVRNVVADWLDNVGATLK